jgi:hypothetical protein
MLLHPGFKPSVALIPVVMDPNLSPVAPNPAQPTLESAHEHSESGGSLAQLDRGDAPYAVKGGTDVSAERFVTAVYTELKSGAK